MLEFCLSLFSLACSKGSLLGLLHHFFKVLTLLFEVPSGDFVVMWCYIKKN